MRKYIVASVFAVAALIHGSTQRVVLIEDFTATWCTYCPGAARAADELKFRAFDSVVVIAYHSSSSDPFYTSTAAQRFNYYSISGYPTMKFDGIYQIQGGLHTGTKYPAFRQIYDSRTQVPSSLDMDLTVAYDSTNRTGNLSIVVKNTGTASVSAQLQTALVESHIYYRWQGMD
ncbi:MAG: hypothetical protein ABIK62_05830, partial [candidate division WOR-3 bacterium]